jgi:hypothetical protein
LQKLKDIYIIIIDILIFIIKERKIKMEDWKTRLIEERKELGEKVERLIKFLNENKECEDFDLLAEQLHYMTGYYEVLTKRVSKLSK